MFLRIMEKTKADSTFFYYLKFAIAYSEYEWETCLEIAKEVEKFGASLPLQTANAIRREALCYIMAVEENQNYGIWGEKADYDRKKAIAQYKRLSPENGLEGTLRYLAGFHCSDFSLVFLAFWAFSPAAISVISCVIAAWRTLL